MRMKCKIRDLELHFLVSTIQTNEWIRFFTPITHPYTFNLTISLKFTEHPIVFGPIFSPSFWGGRGSLQLSWGAFQFEAQATRTAELGSYGGGKGGVRGFGDRVRELRRRAPPPANYESGGSGAQWTIFHLHVQILRLSLAPSLFPRESLSLLVIYN